MDLEDFDYYFNSDCHPLGGNEVLEQTFFNLGKIINSL